MGKILQTVSLQQILVRSAYPGNSYNACSIVYSRYFSYNVRVRLGPSGGAGPIFKLILQIYIKPKASSTGVMNVSKITMIIMGTQFIALLIHYRIHVLATCRRRLPSSHMYSDITGLKRLGRNHHFFALLAVYTLRAYFKKVICSA